MKYSPTTRRSLPVRPVRQDDLDSVRWEIGFWLFRRTTISPKSLIGDLAAIWIGL